MENPNSSNNSLGASRKKRLDVVRIKLRSQRPGDIFDAIIDIRKLLQENVEDEAVYKLLLNAVEYNHSLRQEIRNLLNEMIGKGSKSSADALRVLPADIDDLMAEADDAYYGADYEQAVKLYRQILAKEPDNSRAKEQFAKAELIRIAGMPDTNLPRAAIQYFRQARSYIAAQDFAAATTLLNAALEAAKAKSMDFKEAENLLNSLQNLWTADEYKEKANIALKNEQWGSAWDLYSRALLLNPQDQVIKELLDSLNGLLRADSLLDSLSDQKNDEKERMDKLEKIDAYIKAAEEIKPLVNTSLLKNSRTRYNQYQEKGRKTWLAARRTQSAIVTLLVVVLAGVFFLVWKEWGTENPASPTPTPNTTPTFHIMLTTTPTSSKTPAPTLLTAISKPTITVSPVVVVTELSINTSTPTPLGYGVLTASLNAVEDPKTGKLVFPRLERNQFVILTEEMTFGEYHYYKCLWEINDVINKGWVLADFIQFVAAPTANP